MGSPESSPKKGLGGGSLSILNDSSSPAQEEQRWRRKLLTQKRVLSLNLQQLESNLKRAKPDDLYDLETQFQDLNSIFSNYISDVKDNISTKEIREELITDITTKFDQCCLSHTTTMRNLLGERECDPVEHCSSIDHEIGPEDSASQVTDRHSVSTTVSKRSVRQIEIDLRRIELRAAHARDLAKAKAKAKAAAAAAAEAAAEAEAADAEAKLRVEEARLEAEERLSTLSRRGSSVTSFRAKFNTMRNCESKIPTVLKVEENKVAFSRSLNQQFENARNADALPVGGLYDAGSAPAETMREFPGPSRYMNLPSAADAPREQVKVNPASSNSSVFEAYLERQGRNEYINLATQIAYDGQNISYVFYENQIRKLMNESPNSERRLEVLRASCVGQPREMVNLFLAPMKSMSTTERIEKALNRLRERYGVSGGLITEPKIIEIRHGSKVVFNTASLKSFNEDLNTLEVYAYAHDEIGKLSGQLLMDVANRLPGVLKRRYLDFLSRKGLNLNRPGFDSLRQFVVHELNVMRSEYAQTFFKDEKDKPRDSGGAKGSIRTRQVTVKSNENQTLQTNSAPQRNLKPPPLCFVCDDSKSRHFLADCHNFKTLTNEQKKRVVVDAGRCLNCLSLGHVVRNCQSLSKCRRCGPRSSNKHAGPLHESFIQPRSASGVVEKAESASGAAAVSEDKVKPSNDNSEVLVSRKTHSFHNNVLLRTSAVRVLNPRTGKSTLVYAQHDTASQATLVSERLINELKLDVNKDHTIMIRTLADQSTSSIGLAAFTLQSLSSNEYFKIKNAVVVPRFMDDESALPHSVNVKNLKHFEGVEIPVLPQRKNIDILIGQSDKLLLAVIEEQESLNPDDPNYVLTRLGPIASGGRVEVESSLEPLSLKVQVNDNCHDCEKCEVYSREIAQLKEAVRIFEVEDEALQPSANDEIVRNLVETNVRVVNDRYEVPVPLKDDVVKALPNNYSNALNRTSSVRRKALKDPKLMCMLTDTFKEMISEGWLVEIDGGSSDDASSWYLPFLSLPRRSQGWFLTGPQNSGEPL